MKFKNNLFVATMAAVVGLAASPILAHPGPEQHNDTAITDAQAAGHVHREGDGWIGFHGNDAASMSRLYDGGTSRISADGRTLTWDSSLPVAAIEWYVGHGQRGGRVVRTNLTGARTSVPMQSNRFNLVMSDGRYLYVPGDRPTTLNLTGLGVATDLHDRNGNVTAALVYTGS